VLEDIRVVQVERARALPNSIVSIGTTEQQVNLSTRREGNAVDASLASTRHRCGHEHTIVQSYPVQQILSTDLGEVVQ